MVRQRCDVMEIPEHEYVDADPCYEKQYLDCCLGMGCAHVKRSRYSSFLGLEVPCSSDAQPVLHMVELAVVCFMLFLILRMSYYRWVVVVDEDDEKTALKAWTNGEHGSAQLAADGTVKEVTEV